MLDELERARNLVQSARRVVILTGAGVSAESGIPTFRSGEGLWGQFRPEELATPEAFARDPETVWEWYAWRRGLILECMPNEGHRAIARLLLSRDGVTLATQNVDGLHGRALRELQSEGVGLRPDGRAREPGATLELHGNILRSRCSMCPEADDDGSHPGGGRSDTSLPRCPSCNAPMRPAVVWFGEMLDPGVLDRAMRAARDADICISAGTSALVHPAAGIPMLTHESGGCLIEVNPEVTPLSPFADIHLRGAGAEILPKILKPLD